MRPVDVAHCDSHLDHGQWAEYTLHLTTEGFGVEDASHAIKSGGSGWSSASWITFIS